MSKQLVNLRSRISRNKKKVIYFLDYIDESGNRQRPSLGHSNKRKAEKQRAEKEHELRNDLISPESMKLSKFMKDSLQKTGKQIRESSRREYKSAMNAFISTIGDIDYQTVHHKHGELFIQAMLDKGLSKATVKKRLREISRFFQLAVLRRQLDDNPLKNVRAPKVPKKKIRIFSKEECHSILQAAIEYRSRSQLNWTAIISLALITGMRRGELLNLIWDDIDFDRMIIEIQPKKDTKHTWEWQIKDSDSRSLPITKQATQLLADLLSNHPAGYPYVLVPPARYDCIQKIREEGKWSLIDSRLKVVNNFTRQFKEILEIAGVKHGQFHDLRRTALSNFIAQGLSEYHVMKIAGHANFSTTHDFYLEVTNNVIDQARQASEKGLCQDLAHFWHAP